MVSAKDILQEVHAKFSPGVKIINLSELKSPAMTKAEYPEYASKHYNELQALNKIDNL